MGKITSPIAVSSVAMLVLLLGLLGLAPGQDSKDKQDGKALVEQYCGGCHLPPPPQILPRKSWPFVMDWMGNYLGVRNLEGTLGDLVHPDRVPAEPIAGEQDLEAIRSYFVSRAPKDPLPQEGKAPPRGGFSLFRPRPLSLIGGAFPLVTLLKIDEPRHRLFVGDGMKNEALVFSSEHWKLLERHRVASQPIAVRLREDGFDLTVIGDLDADRHRGELIRYRWLGDRYELQPLLRGYHRIAHLLFGDVNQNGREDFIVSAFGDYDKGRFAWFEQLEDGRHQEHMLIERSGALKAELNDFTGNGIPDILVLMAQGRNELILFEGLGGGQFRQRQLFEQHPGFGYHEFHSVDFNGDGALDLVVVNGNNLEIPDPPLRNYHGIRIYLNDGRGNFTERFFYPMYGAVKAVSADFNRNGNIDLAAIAYCPDWELDVPETFVYLENLGNFEFRPWSVPEAAWGRWITLVAGDLDGDGNIDLVLGNGGAIKSGIPSASKGRFRERFNNTPVLWLENLAESQ